MKHFLFVKKRINISVKYLQQNLKLPKRLPHLSGHGLTFEDEGFDRHQLTVALHTFIVPI